MWGASENRDPGGHRRASRGSGPGSSVSFHHRPGRPEGLQRKVLKTGFTTLLDGPRDDPPIGISGLTIREGPPSTQNTATGRMQRPFPDYLAPTSVLALISLVAGRARPVRLAATEIGPGGNIGSLRCATFGLKWWRRHQPSSKSEPCGACSASGSMCFRPPLSTLKNTFPHPTPPKCIQAEPPPPCPTGAICSRSTAANARGPR